MAQHRAEDPVANMWQRAKDRAARDGIRFSIFIDNVRRVWPANGRCPVSGVRLGRGLPAPSLDRLDNRRGYEPGNIAVISWGANRLKNSATAAQLERVAAWMRSLGLE